MKGSKACREVSTGRILGRSLGSGVESRALGVGFSAWPSWKFYGCLGTNRMRFSIGLRTSRGYVFGRNMLRSACVLST